MTTWAPRIYWYPDPSGTLETLTLSHVSTYDCTPVSTAADAQILHGGFVPLRSPSLCRAALSGPARLRRKSSVSTRSELTWW